MASVEIVDGSALHRPDVLSLYDSVGWSVYTGDADRLMRALEGSSTVVAARVNDRLVGIARAISDGASVVYLQDVLVRPSAQRGGLGRLLVEAVLSPYADVRQKVLLTDDEPAQRAFYESLGFAETRDFGDGTLRVFVRFA